MSDCLEKETLSSTQSVASQGATQGIGPAITQQEGGLLYSQSQSSSQSTNQGPDLNWNFDGMEDKNPFSGFSEEHLNKLDEVLSSAGVQELLQQSSPDLSFLNLDGTENLSGGAGHGGQGDTARASTSSRRDSSDSLPESIISVVFSDHGYCLNPEKVQKAKVVTTQPATRTLPAVVTVEPVPEVIPVGTTPTALGMSTDSDAENTDSKTESPYTSPRKSGRVHTKSKYLDEDWVTQGSPTKGRGRGRGVMPAMPSPFGFRASTRISDQKQRDLAEKIMLANRQAMEAMKNQDDTEDSEQVIESPVKTSPKGRGRGKGKTSPARKVGDKGSQSSQEESSQDESQEEEEEEGDKAVNVDESEESESEPEKPKTKKGGKTKAKTGKKKKKKGGKYEEDSDYSEEESNQDKKKAKGKKKGKKESEDEEPSDTKTKKGKKKKLAKEKKKAKPKGKKGKKKGGKADKKTDDSVVSESETKDKAEEKSPKKASKKLSKKERLKKLKEAKEAKKAKLLEKKKEKKKGKKKKGKVTETETEASDTSPKKKKALQKGKAGVGKKKADTVEETVDASPKKKAKVTETKKPETKSPKPGEKRKASPARAAKGKAEAPVSTPTKKQKLSPKKQKSKVEVTDSEEDKPLSKVKVDTEKDTKENQEPSVPMASPSRGDQNIFASFSADLIGDVSEENKTKTNDNNQAKSEKVVENTVIKTLAEEVKADSVKSDKEIVDVKSDKEIVDVKSDKEIVDVKSDKEIVDVKSDKEIVAVKSDKETVDEVEIEDKQEDIANDNTVSVIENEMEDKENKSTKELETKEELKEVKSDESKSDEQKSENDSKDTIVSIGDINEKDSHKEEKKHSETLKRHDSEDSKGSHHHHHHHHRRHSHEKRESVSEDKTDSGSHRNESHDRKDSSDRRQSHDRRDSHSQDRDRKSSRSRRVRHGRKSSDTKDRDKKDSVKDRKDSSSGMKDTARKVDSSKDRRESVGSVSSDKNGRILKSGDGLKKVGKLNKDGKGKVKKSKKAEELPIDSSMADLFMPDNLPTPSKEEVVTKAMSEKERTLQLPEEKERVSKVTFKDDSVKSSKKTKVKTEQEKSVEPEIIQVDDEQNLDELPDITESKTDVGKNEKPKISKVKKETVTGVKVASQSISEKILKTDSESSSIIASDLETDKAEKQSENEGRTDETEKVDISSHIPPSKEMDIEENLEEKAEVDIETNEKEEKDTKTTEEKATPLVQLKEDQVTGEAEDVLVIDVKKTKSITDNEDKSSKENLTEKKENAKEKVETQKKPKNKGPLKMSDFFSERRLKINDPKPRLKVVKEEASTEEGSDGADDGSGRRKRNKAKAFAEILKKEKLGSDDEDESDSDYEDDENDEDFEDPDQLYCICQQPHNQRHLEHLCFEQSCKRDRLRFMICCDKCEEWFHGKCVGVTRVRGAEMEKNNEEYICPQCEQAEKGEIQDGKVASTTQSPEQPVKVSKTAETSVTSETDGSPEVPSTSAEEPKVIKPDSTVDKETSEPGKQKAEPQTPKSAKAPGEATPKSQKTLKKPAVSLKSKHAGEETPKKKGQEVTSKLKSLKDQTTPKSEGKTKEKSVGSGKKKSEAELSEKRKRVIQMVKEENQTKDKPKQPYNKCFSCNIKSPRKDSLYCSDDCRAKHSKHNVVPGILKMSAEKDKKKGKKEKHVAVVETSTGRTLTGDKAPTESELTAWLEENPTFEILKSHNKPTSKSVGSSSSDKKTDKKEASKSSKSERSSKSEKNEGPEPIRLNVRKGLRDALAARANGADDVMLSSSEIKGVALSIEEELFKYFKDTDAKYKAKYRSLIFNIKDQKNKGLFRKILGGRIRASKLVRMTADELANRELAQWREHETKHTIEMIKQTETEHLNEPVHVMKKTHKGEEEVADEEGEDLSALADEPKKKDDAVKADHKEDEEAESLPDTTDMHGQHLFDANCKICTGKLVPVSETTPTKSKTVKTETTPTAKKEEKKELTKKERDLQADEVVKEVLKAIQRAKEDERKEQLEAQQRSSVTVRSPDSALSSGLDKNVKFTPIGPMLWKGFIFMQDVCKFITSAYKVTGSADHLNIPDTITLCGRISPEHVWDYLSKVKQSATRDICVVRFIPGVSEEKAAYINLYSYLNSRSRCGVVEHKAKNVKDFYIVPLASHSKIPSVLLPFDGPGLEENRCHMLLGVLIRNKVKQSSIRGLDRPQSSHSRHSHRQSKSKPLKSALKDPFEPESSDKSSSSSPKTSSSSSTPQTISAEKKKAISFDPIVKEYSHVSEQEETYEPGSDDPLDLNAPYDPEKEALKETAKPKPEKAAKPDPVTLMMEKIAHSKNPAEATAAMVAALATTSKLGNQRKLLLELTKKVDEQKRLLEQKRISAKLGQSPSGSSPSPSSTTVTSTSTSSIGISSKDPRLRAQNAAATASSSNNVTSEPMDIDLRIPVGVQAPTGVQPPTGAPAPVGVPPPSGVLPPVVSLSLTPIIKPSSVLPSSITASALEKSVSILSSLTSEIASDAASPGKTVANKSDKSQTSVRSVSVSTASSVLGEGEKNKQKKQSDNSDSIIKPKGFYVDHAEKEADTGNASTIASNTNSKNDKDKTSESSEVKSSGDKSVSVKSDFDGPGVKSEKEKSKQGAQHEIITQLMAEVSGKASSDSKPVKKQTDSKDSEIQEKTQETKKDQPEPSSSKPVPNVAALFKGLANTSAGNSETGKKSGIQLPSALMSLFSKLPGSAEDPKESEPAKIPGLFTADVEEPAEDTDLRQTDASTGEVSVSKTDSEELKDSDDKLSKSFLGFDYDSDSSGGSFEGFDDDGTKKLSPRKRKLVQKSPRALSPVRNSPRTNLFGDVDERGTPPMEDVDFRQEIEDDVDLRPDFDSEPKDIDERLQIPITTASGQPLPPGEGPMHPFPPPPGMRLPFVPSSQPPPPGLESEQPPPPGVDWEHPTPTSMPVGMPNMPPHTGEWGPPPLPDSQPPLPAEPPTPKPPEPPVKKKKAEDEGSRKDDDESDNEGESRYQSKNSKKKKKKKERKNKKGGPVASDERLKQIVIEIAKKEPIDPPPMPPLVRQMHRMPYDPSQQMMPMSAMGGPVPHGVPVTSQLMPHSMSGMDMPTAGNTSWMESGPIGPPLNAQSQMVPPNLPPHLQPGVAANPQHIRQLQDSPGRQLPITNKDRSAGGRNKGPPMKEYAKKPPSLLDLPDLLPPPKLMKSAEMASVSASASPSVRESRGSAEDFCFDEVEQNFTHTDMDPKNNVTDATSQEMSGDRRRDQEERSRERDRDERRRRDRRRSRSGDRSRRSKSGERRYRSRSNERDPERQHRERSHDHDRHHYRDSRDRDRDRGRDRNNRERDRGYRSHRH